MLASAKFTVLLNFNLGLWSSFPSLAEGAPNHLGTEWDAYSCVSCGCRNKPAQTRWLERTEIKGPFYAKHGSEDERKRRGYITCLRAHSHKRQYRQADPELSLVTLRSVLCRQRLQDTQAGADKDGSGGVRWMVGGSPEERQGMHHPGPCNFWTKTVNS